MSQTAVETPAWQQQAADQLAELEEGVPEGTSHVVVNLTPEGQGVLLHLANSESEGVILADDASTKVAGEVKVVPFSLLTPLIGGLDNADLDLEQTVTLGDAATGADEDLPDGTGKGPDAETGKLFDIPRVAIVVDETDPTVLKIALSGSIELDRGDKTQADLFNLLAAGKVCNLHVNGYVKSGPTNTHRRDSEGNVDAVVAQKSIVITDLRLD